MGKTFIAALSILGVAATAAVVDRVAVVVGKIVITESEDVVRKLCRQIEKQVEVLKVYYHTNEDVIWQELALYKVSTDVIAEKVSVERLLRENGARAVVIRKDYTVFETTGHREETDNLISILQPYGLIEFVRSARVAII